jgi:hypothetical protein
MRRPTTTAVGLSMLLAATLAACGDDDTAGTSGDPDSAYCALAAELQASETPPTEDQLVAIVEAADPDIREDVEAFVEAARTGVYPPGIEAHEEAILAWEADHCGDTFGGEQETQPEG